MQHASLKFISDFKINFLSSSIGVFVYISNIIQSKSQKDNGYLLLKTQRISFFFLISVRSWYEVAPIITISLSYLILIIIDLWWFLLFLSQKCVLKDIFRLFVGFFPSFAGAGLPRPVAVTPSLVPMDHPLHAHSWRPLVESDSRETNHHLRTAVFRVWLLHIQKWLHKQIHQNGG